MNENLMNGFERSKSPISTLTESKKDVKVNKYKLIGKHIDMVSLVVFMLVWVIITIGFMATITS